MANEPNDGTIQSVNVVVSILELLQERDGARVTEVAEELEIAKSTVHRHLKTLLLRDLIVKEGDEYQIGLRFLELGEYAKNRKPAYLLAEEKVEELAATTDERAQFIVEEHGQGVYVYSNSGEHGVVTYARDGRRLELYRAAAGKAILAFLPERKQEQLLDTITLDAVGPNTITDADQLRSTLDEIQDQGYATNIEESTSGVHAIGAPVMTHDRTEPLGAFSISGPASRLKRERIETEVRDLVLSATNELELHLEHS